MEKWTEHLENGPDWEEMLACVNRDRQGSRHRFKTDIQLRVPVSEVDDENSWFFKEVLKDGIRYLVTKDIALTIVLGPKTMVLFFHALKSLTSTQLIKHTPLQKILLDLCCPDGYFALFYDEFTHHIMVDREIQCGRYGDKDNFISTISVDKIHDYPDPDDWRWISEMCDDADDFVTYCIKQIRLLDESTRNTLNLHLGNDMDIL